MTGPGRVESKKRPPIGGRCAKGLAIVDAVEIVLESLAVTTFLLGMRNKNLQIHPKHLLTMSVTHEFRSSLTPLNALDVDTLTQLFDIW